MALRWREMGVVLVVVFGGLVLIASPASACSCGGLTADLAPEFDAIFVATAVDQHDSDLGPNMTEVLFEVEELYAGRVHRREPVLVRSGDGDTCGVEPPIGVSQGIAAVRHPDGFLDLNLCSFAAADEVRRLFTVSAMEGGAAEDLSGLQEGAVLVEGQGPDIALPSTWGRRKIGSVALAVVLMASIAVLAYRRRFDTADDPSSAPT